MHPHWTELSMQGLISTVRAHIYEWVMTCHLITKEYSLRIGVSFISYNLSNLCTIRLLATNVSGLFRQLYLTTIRLRDEAKSILRSVNNNDNNNSNNNDDDDDFEKKISRRK